MPPASGHAHNETTPVVDAGDSAVPAVVGRTRVRTSGVVPGHQRDDQAQSDSDDSEMDRFYSLQLGRNSSRCARSFITGTELSVALNKRLSPTFWTQ